MHTSILLVAIGAMQATGATHSLEWKSDYATASNEGKNARKPLAVFVGRGADGWAQVSETGRLGPEAHELLAANYICLYVDRNTPAGQRLAADLEMVDDGPGIVISDHTGELQAFRRSGKLAPEALVVHLRTFSDPTRTVTRTDTGERQEIRYYPPAATYPAYGYYPNPGFSFRGCSS